MHESYWFGFSICDLLFKGLNLHSFGGFLLTCVILVLLAALFEAIKLCQITVKLKALVLLSPSNLNLFCFNDRSSLLQSNINDGTSSSGSNSNNNNNKRTTLFFVEVLLYMLQISLGYILMLIVMTFNVYFTIALVGGAGIGYFVFGLQNAEAKLKMAKLNIPCQHCLHNNREDSAVSTLVENESVVGSSSLRQVDIDSPTEVPCSSHADAEVHPCNAETTS